jgi:hypothetical protein
MVDRWWAYLLLCLIFAVNCHAEESFRTFTTADGKSFPFRVLSYEGQEFYFEDQSKNQYKVSYTKFSSADQKYLIDLAQNGKIPEGDPRKLVATANSSVMESTPKSDSDDTSEASAEPIDGPRLKAPPKKKPKLRPGSFFAYKPVNLGQDPSLAEEKKGGGMPKPGEPIDFTNHVLPILENRCFSCHQEPYDKNGRTIQPKAGLALNTYELVM